MTENLSGGYHLPAQNAPQSPNLQSRVKQQENHRLASLYECVGQEGETQSKGELNKTS